MLMKKLPIYPFDTTLQSLNNRLVEMLVAYPMIPIFYQCNLKKHNEGSTGPTTSLQMENQVKLPIM